MTDHQQPLSGEQWHATELIWDYHQMHHTVRPTDAAIGLGSHDLGVAAYSAELYRAGLFPVLVFSGGNSPTTEARFPRGEAVHDSEHALDSPADSSPPDAPPRPDWYARSGHPTGRGMNR
ncbi:hypothetical protein ACFT1B_34040, partial [Streptomyces griseoincarnatus]